MGKKENDKEKLSGSASVIGMAQSSLIQTHGEAASQMIQAYKGVRYDAAGNDLGHMGRSLKEISKYKVNKGYEQQNIKQQSGFSAELIHEARKNKEAILNGDKTRVRTTDGLGDTNNTQYDHVLVDEKGNVIKDSGSQMKFLKVGQDKNGNNTYKVIDNLAKKEDWNRYDGKIDIPKGQYKDAVDYADRQAEKLREQAQRANENGKPEVAKKLNEQADQYEKAKSRIRESEVTQEEAINARKNPEKFVAKEVLKDSHHAGVEAAKGAALLSGSISISQNLYAVVAEGKELDEAAKDVAATTAKSCIVAYGVGVTGTTIKSVMHASSKEMVRRLGNTNLPALIATSAVEITKSMKKFAKGEIDDVQLLEELGEMGTGMLAAGFSSAVGATVGGAIGSVVPVVGTALGATVGGFIGSMIGYSASSMLYNGALEALKGAKISAERRAIIEAMASKAIEEEEKYQKALTAYAKAQYNKREEVLCSLLNEIKTSLINNDINGYIGSINKIGSEFGVKLQFDSFEEIDTFMMDQDSVFKI